MDDLASFARDLSRAALGAQARAVTALQKTAQDIEGTAKSRAPVDTGALRASIGTDTTYTRGEVTAVIGPEVNYGKFVELGTARHGPQPYLQPAFDEYAPLLDQAIASLIGDL